MSTVSMSHLSETLNSKPSSLHYTLGGAIFIVLAIFVFAGFRQTNLVLSPQKNLAALVPATVSPKPVGLEGMVPGIGECLDVKVIGNYAYVANTMWGLTVVDVSNPAAPTIVTSSPISFTGAQINVSGNLAVVTGSRWVPKNGLKTQMQGIYFFDITNPLRPSIVGIVESIQGQKQNPIISPGGDRLYISILTNGLYVIDINKVRNYQPTTDNPTIPFLAGGLGTDIQPGDAVVAQIKQSGITYMTLNGQYLYLSTWNGLKTMNVTNLTPVEEGTLKPDVVFSGQLTFVSRDPSDGGHQLAYLGNINRNIEILNMDNPAAPISIAIRQLPVFMDKIFVVEKMKQVGNRLYLSKGGNGGYFISLDISNRLNPEPNAMFLIPTSSDNPPVVSGIDVVNNIAYIASVGSGLTILSGADTVAPAAPIKVIATLIERFAARGIASKPGYAAIIGTKYPLNNTGAGIQSLRVINTQDRTRPFIAGEYTNAGSPFSDVALFGNYAYIAEADKGMQVVDLSYIPSNPDPLHPTSLPVISTQDTPGWASRISVYGSKIYLGDGYGGVSIYDIGQTDAPGTPGTPSNPKFLLSYKNPLAGNNYLNMDLDANTNTLYASTGNSIDIVNLSPPEPVLIKRYPVGVTNNETKVDGSMAYIAGGYDGIRAVDLSNLNSTQLPIFKGSLAPLGGPNASTRAIVKNGNNLYAANYDGGIWRVLIDSSNTTNTLSYSSSVVGAENIVDVVIDASDPHYVYGADTYTGMIIAYFPDIAPPVTPTYHPADTSRNYSIETSEALNYASCWKRLCTTANPPVPIPAFYLTSATSFWKRTGPYHYVSTPACTPTNPACFVVGP